MSIALMTLAFKTSLPPTQKFVLVALSDWANDQGECYPSIPALAEKCSMGERTVQTAISALEGLGQVRREFRKGRSTTYWITPTPADPAPRGRSSGTPARPAPPQDLHHTPADPAPPPPQDLHHTPADPAPITIKEPSVEPLGKRKSAAAAPALARPDDVVEATWRDWCGLRKAKKATVSETVLSGAREEAAKAGMTLEAFLREWCVRGSQGLKAEWLKPQERAGPATGRAKPRNQAEIDEINARNNEETRRLLFGNQETIDG